MKAFSNWVCLGLMILVGLSPVFVLWKIWQYHLEFVHAQHLALLPSPPTSQYSTNSGRQFIQLMVQSMTQVTPILWGFGGSLVVGFLSGRGLSDRYRLYQEMQMREKVAILERIWQQSLY